MTNVVIQDYVEEARPAGCVQKPLYGKEALQMLAKVLVCCVPALHLINQSINLLKVNFDDLMLGFFFRSVCR